MKARHLGSALAVVMLLATDVLAAKKPDDSWRTQVPPITAKRWTKAPPPIPKPRKITREDYGRMVSKFRQPMRPARIAKIDDHTQPFNSLWARREAFLYTVTKKEKYARNAARFLRTALRYWTEGPGSKLTTSARYFIAAGNAYREIRNSRSLTQADHETVRKLLYALERRFANWEEGAFNRATAGAGACRILMHFCPEAGEGKLTHLREKHPLEGMTRQAYADKVWDMWWRYRDHDENSAGYNGLFFSDALGVLHITEQDEVLKDPAMKKLAERYLMQVAPVGAMPAYGDSVCFFPKPVYWIAVFEKFATVYRDGRFKWAAHRMMDFYLRQEKSYSIWRDPLVEHLIDAYQWADDSIPEEVPTAGSLVNYRKAIVKTPLDYHRKKGTWFWLEDRPVPDKIIFRTGWQPDDTYAMIDLCPPIGHGHRDTGAITSLVSQGSVLLFDTPYLVKDHRFHDCFVMVPDQRPRGWSWHNETYWPTRKVTVAVEDFHAAGKAGLARASITNYMDLRCNLQRRVFFLGDAGLWVRDTIAAGKGIPAGKAFRGKIGPAYQFVALYPKRGTNWVNGCQISLPGADIWNPQYTIQLANRPWDLLVWFAPKTDATMVVDDVTFDESKLIIRKQKMMTNAKFRAWQQMTRLQAGQSETFDSVLLPHKPVADATPLAEGIRSLLDEGPDRAVMQVTPKPRTVLYAGINTDGKPLKAGPIETDAKVFLVRTRGGKVTGFWAVEATSLKVDGKAVHGAPERATVDKLD